MENDRNDACCAFVVSLHRSFGFDAVAVIGGNEVWTDQQQDDVSLVEMCINLGGPCSSSTDIAIVPLGNQSLPLKRTQMGSEPLAPVFILVGIGIEHFDGWRRFSHAR